MCDVTQETIVLISTIVWVQRFNSSRLVGYSWTTLYTCTTGRTRYRQGAVAWRCRAGRAPGGLRRRTQRSGAELRTEHPSDRYSNGGVVRPSSVAPAYGRVTKWHCQRNGDPATRRTRSQRRCRVSPCSTSDYRSRSLPLPWRLAAVKTRGDER